MHDKKKKMTFKDMMKSNEVIIASATGLCLVAKTWIIRHILDQEINVNDLYIPPVIMLIYETLYQYSKEHPEKNLQKYTNPWHWALIIIGATALSILLVK